MGDAVVLLFFIIISWELVNLLTLIGELLLLFVFIHFLCLSKETLRLALRAGSTKEKSPSLRNFLPYQAKTVLFVPRRYRSFLSERPASILNRGKFDCVHPSDLKIFASVYTPYFSLIVQRNPSTRAQGRLNKRKNAFWMGILCYHKNRKRFPKFLPRLQDF